MKVGILNTAIITADGDFTLKTISLEEAKEIVLNNTIDSAVGHKAKAEILTSLLGVEIPVNRQNFQQKRGQKCLVFKLNQRVEEGKILTLQEIEEVGYSFKLLSMH